MNEQEQFLKDLEPKEELDAFNQPIVPEKEPEEEKEEETPRNRRERRLEAKLQAERESAIALAARLEALTEAQKFRQETTPSEWEKKLERIYGNQTPEAIEATNLLKEALKDATAEAKAQALEEWKKEQAQANEAVAVEEKNLDAIVEELEDEYGVAFDENTSKSFFQLLERLSPKDRDGNIIEYADHHAVWEMMQRSKPSNRAKELASRSTVQTAASSTENTQQSVEERYLRSIGIL